jgi:hypothetical protein
MDAVKGDPLVSVPGRYPERNRRVRTVFDLLEVEFAAALPSVMDQARRARARDPQAAACQLDEFTDTCVQRVVVALRGLLSEWGAYTLN